mmetsp:Transcript_13270/g.26202  ORF Transcript_13270/g.26202 Transcript_13270/m.26202 type:complete len:85 (+) Transcript_13270:559-813(+)
MSKPEFIKLHTCSGGSMPSIRSHDGGAYICWSLYILNLSASLPPPVSLGHTQRKTARLLTQRREEKGKGKKRHSTPKSKSHPSI